jgi:hypothetical protein
MGKTALTSEIRGFVVFNSKVAFVLCEAWEIVFLGTQILEFVGFCLLLAVNSTIYSPLKILKT